MHDLETMQNGTARMVYSERVTPWHGLGRTIAGMTPDDAVTALAVEDLVKLPLWGKLADRDILIAGHAAIVAPSTGEVLSVMSADYEIHQPRAVLNFFREFTEAGAMSLETAGFLNRGRRMWAQASIGKSFELAEGDTINGYLLMATSFDGTLATIARDSQTCVVCQNTLSAALAERGNKRDLSIRHSVGLTPEIIARAKEAMGLAVTRFDQTVEFAQRLSEFPVSGQFKLTFAHGLTDAKFAKVIAEKAQENEYTFGEQLLRLSESSNAVISLNAVDLTPDINALTRRGRTLYEEIERSPGNSLPNRQNTAWGVLNGVTSYIDHTAGRERDTALSSAWFGQGQNMKDRAQEVLAEVLAA